MKSNHIKGDLVSGVIVFLIAVPLCLGIALASGAPLYAGMIAGMSGGLVVGLLSKSQVSIAGPAAGLTAIVLSAITSMGDFRIFLAAVVLAGLLQLLMGFLKAGTVANYFPSNVIKGMLAAIGLIIVLKQIPHAVGFDEDAVGDFSFRQLNGENTFSSLAAMLDAFHPGAVLIAGVSLLVLIFWKKIPGLGKIPAPLAAVVLGVAMQEAFRAWMPGWGLDIKQLVQLPVPDDLAGFVGQFTFPDFSALAGKEVWITAMTIAVVASLETLLNVEATDKLDPQRRYTPPNRELKAQGVGNLVSGLLGGLPVTSVIVRSSVNINAGGRTRLSTITHGALLLVCAAMIPGLLNRIPLATLAALLIITGYKLCNPAIFREMFAKGKHQWVPFLVTVVAIVWTDLLIGVLLGLAVSVISILRGNIKSPYFFHKGKYRDGDLIRIELAQEVSFLNKASIQLTLEALPEKSTVLIDGSRTVYVAHDVLELIREFRDVKAPEKQITLLLSGFRKVYKIPNSGHTFILKNEGENIAWEPTAATPPPAQSHRELLKELIN
ncbi:SulP family inorganic anion transporter [Compostibacter hankyongensis]|uniref:SulP family inorganic anion transporter n=1 Tax=Compostibacter hankyongensis TaxID=1007089 RepID=A0ABP8FC43_9BACT